MPAAGRAYVRDWASSWRRRNFPLHVFALVMLSLAWPGVICDRFAIVTIMTEHFFFYWIDCRYPCRPERSSAAFNSEWSRAKSLFLIFSIGLLQRDSKFSAWTVLDSQRRHRGELLPWRGEEWEFRYSEFHDTLSTAIIRQNSLDKTHWTKLTGQNSLDKTHCEFCLMIDVDSTSWKAE